MGSLLREQIGSTFSDRWYEVAAARPRLSPTAQVTRQRLGQTETFILEEPAGSKYYRLSPSAWFFAGLLDGRRSVDEAWQACNAQLGDDAPTQRECLDVLARLQMFGLLLGDQPMAADMLEQRIRRVRKSRRDKRTGKWFAFTIPLINPEPLLERHAGLVRAMWSRWALAVWAAIVVSGTFLVVMNASQLGDPLSALFTPRIMVLIAVLFLVLRAVHELGHATACKAFGGRSTEIGVILIAMVLPLPYCDASSAWRFSETWKRVVVSLGGIFAELLVAGLAAIVWALADPERAAAVRTVAYHTMLISGVTTLLFNLNPLLRYDGYYILSDLAGVPNLSQRSKDLWRHLIERIGFGVKNNKPPQVRSTGEAWLMGVYGLLSTPYRWFIAISIILLVSTKFMTLGLLLAAMAFSIMIVWPTLKNLGYLASSPRLLGHRGRAWAVSGSLALLLVVALAIAPAPAGAYAPASLEPESLGLVRTSEAGFVVAVLAQAGDEVEEGQAVITLRNDELAAELAITEARLERAEAELDAAVQSSPAEAVSASDRARVLRGAVDRLRVRTENLIVRAPENGAFIPPGGLSLGASALVGTYVNRGDALGAVARTDSLIVRATLSDADQSWVFRSTTPDETPATVRLRGRAGTELRARIVSVAPVASMRLENPSLGTASGGELATDPTDSEGSLLLTPRFRVDLEPVGERWATVGELNPGVRARVRLAAPNEPLLGQWFRKARRYLDARFSS